MTEIKLEKKKSLQTYCSDTTNYLLS